MSVNVKRVTLPVRGARNINDYFKQLNPKVIGELGDTYANLHWSILKQGGQSAQMWISGVTPILVILASFTSFFFLSPGIAAITVFSTTGVMLISAKFVRHLLLDKSFRMPNEAFSLYLRPFVDDRRSHISLSKLTLKQADHLGMLGKNVVAIGSPHERVPPYMGLNVRFLYTRTTENWQKSVVELIGSASEIWLRCGSQKWLLWEMEQLLNQGRLVDTTFIVPPDNKAETWRSVLSRLPPNLAAALASIDEREVLTVSFTRRGDAICIFGEPCGGAEYISAICLARHLRIQERSVTTDN